MMMSEFIDRTGFEPTAKEYAKIEEACCGFGGDRDAFFSPMSNSIRCRAEKRPSDMPRYSACRCRMHAL